MDRLRFGSEVRRKAIHVASAAIPILVWFLPREYGIAILLLSVTAALGIEWARREVRAVRYVFLTQTRGLLRNRERHGISGATFMAIGYLAAVALFPRPIAVAAMLYNAFGDALAAVVGTRWGRHRIRGGKSLEGAGAGFLINVAVGTAVPGIPIVAALVGGAIAALLELLPIPIDDNLSVTIGGGLGLWLGMSLA